MHQTWVRYTGFVSSQRYQKGVLWWSWNEVYNAIRWHTANSCVRSNCEMRYCLLWFRLVIASA